VWLLRIVLFALLTVVLVIVALGNNTPVPVQFLGSQWTDVPLYLVIFGAILAGLFVGLAVVGIREIQWRMNVSKDRKQKTLLENEVRNLRAAPLEGLDEEQTRDPERF
jgi:uncharacterized integral membrane protein